MNILIIGGAGFLGQKLANALIARGTLCGKPVSALTLADRTGARTPDGPCPVRTVNLDITDRAQVDRLFEENFDVVYHLAAVVSGQAEAEFNAGLAVNLYGSLNIFEGIRASGTCPVLVFTSSVAVFGGDVPHPVDDWTIPNPQTSYGAQKAACELFVTDYSRKGYFDGRALRLPTITVRPGKPNRAASSFMSSIFREPLQGEEAICPVAPDYRLFALSPRRCIGNLIHGAEIPASDWGENRALTLPGKSYMIVEMLEAMERVAGPDPLELVRFEPDEEIQKVVSGWRAGFRTDKALMLGFMADTGFEDNIRYFLEDDLNRGI